MTEITRERREARVEMQKETLDYLENLPAELAQIGQATLRAKIAWDKGCGLEELSAAYDAIITANTLACLLFRNYPLELLKREGG